MITSSYVPETRAYALINVKCVKMSYTYARDHASVLARSWLLVVYVRTASSAHLICYLYTRYLYISANRWMHLHKSFQHTFMFTICYLYTIMCACVRDHFENTNEHTRAHDTWVIAALCQFISSWNLTRGHSSILRDRYMEYRIVVHGDCYAYQHH